MHPDTTRPSTASTPARRWRRTVAGASVGLLGLGVAAPSTATEVGAEAALTASATTGAGHAPLTPADGVPSATITRTSYGIPHIVADDWTSLGFGNGYAATEDAACNLADTLLTARGERSKHLGPDAPYTDDVTTFTDSLTMDTFVTALRDRGDVERLMATEGAEPSARALALVEGYVAGFRQRLTDIGGAAGIDDPACGGAAWVDMLAEEATALDLHYAHHLTLLLASGSVFTQQIVDAQPPSAEDPGTPVSPALLGLPDPTDEQQTLPTPDVALMDRDALMRGLGKDPDSPFGSNATALGADVTDTGRGMLLGNPHFPYVGRNRFHEAQLTIPGVYDVAGGALVGSPVPQVGWNEDVAWTHTYSTAWRFTPYEYRLLGPTTYLTEDGVRELQTQDVTVEVLGDDGSITEVTDTLYRTDEGWVIDAPELAMGWSAASVWAFRDANAEHMRFVDVWLEMGAAGDVYDLLRAHTELGAMPWVNTVAADRDGKAMYADQSVVPNVPDAMVNRCVTPTGSVLLTLAGLPGLDGTRAAGECAWRTDPIAARPGIIAPTKLPLLINSGWSINANDSHWLPNPATPLTGFDGIIGCEQCQRSLRTQRVYSYVLDRLDGSDGLGGEDVFTHEQLKAIQTENIVHAAGVAREHGDLQTVCEQSGVRQQACDVLAAWDGRSDLDSVGTLLFREFWMLALQTSPVSVYEVPFDPAQPLTTPRDIDEANPFVIQAMVDAVAYLDGRGIALDAPLGEHQVAADRGDDRTIGLHGGTFSTGNANTAYHEPALRDTDTPYAITYGSSYIQAVSFTDDGVRASTILTYGNADDPTSPHATDQTRLWSQEGWVEWPFTREAQQADPAHRVERVRGGA